MPSVINRTKKPWPKEVKMAAIELWKAKVPLASIRQQLKMPERTLCRILAHEKQNPGEITELWTIKMADSEYLKKLVESMPRRLSNVIKRERGTSKY
jgi:hypothetical protein